MILRGDFMKAIKIPSSSSSLISVRIDSKLLKDIDEGTLELKQITNNSMSRNQLIELMLKFAAENAVFDINNQELTFEMILNSFRAQNVLFPELLPTSEELGEE